MKKNLLYKSRVGNNYPQIIRDDGSVFEVHGNDFTGYEIMISLPWYLDNAFLLVENPHLPVCNRYSWNPIPKFTTKIQAVKYMIENINKLIGDY